MLTRLRIKGFKNLAEEDIYFGAFTCIAGQNGVGKSNIFDAITFLSALADKPILEAALAVRGTNGRLSDLGEIFTKGVDSDICEMEIEADLITPLIVIDEYDREVRPNATYLTYRLKLAYESNRRGGKDGDPIYILSESLDAKERKLQEAYESLHFLPQPFKANATNDWFKKFVKLHKNRQPSYISTANNLIRLHSEGDQFPGRPSEVMAQKSPRTRLSGVTTEAHATALAARREMQSWRLLHLEPSSLVRMDELRDESKVSVTGAHLPNALLRIGNQAEIATKLADLIPGIISVEVDADEKRQLRSLVVKLKDGVPYAASSLSDGTLRFLALAIMSSDSERAGLLCMEEPENGIHPERIEAMLQLVRQLADTTTDAPESDSATIRQVIINTHSPLVVGGLESDDLLMAQAVRFKGFEKIILKPLLHSWRAKGELFSARECTSKGVMLNYLGQSRVSESSVSGWLGRKKLRDIYTPDMFNEVSHAQS